MTATGRAILASAAALAMAPMLSLAARAQPAWPSRPIRLVVPCVAGSAVAAQHLAGGAIDAAFATLVSAGPVADGGRARFLAVGTRSRVESRPDAPTIQASDHAGFPSIARAGAFGPAATPPAVVRVLSDVLVEAVDEPSIRQRLGQIGCVALATRPTEFLRFVREGRTEMANLVREANIRAE